MDFADILRARYSVRSYRPEPVDEAALGRILDAAVAAPTACNRQPFRVIVLRTAGREAELARIYARPFFVQAPVVLAVVAVHDEAWKRNRSDNKDHSDVDAAIVTDHIVLAATNEGLGTCWVCAFDPAAAREVLGLPEGVEPIAFTPIGHAADDRPARVRKPIADLVRRDRW